MQMPKSRLNVSAQEALSTSPRAREVEGPSRWSEYLSQEMGTPMPSRTSRNNGSEVSFQLPGVSHKGLNMQWVYQLTQVAQGLMAKIYRLNQILDYPDAVGHVYSEAFWKAGVFPNCPKICILLSKKFPEHHSKLQLERVDKVALDALNDQAEVHLQSLEPWIQLLLDMMAFREQALRLILDLSSTVITLLPHQNSLILHAFMDLFCSFVRVNLFAEKLPRKMLLQMYNLFHAMLRNDRDCDFYYRLVQFIDAYDPPLKGLHEDLNFVSPRIGEVLEAVGPIIFLSTDTRKLRNEGFLSPFHPRYPDILTNSAHPMRAQDLANVTSYREWALFGYLVCPDELLRVTSIDIAMVVLKENLVLTLYRDEYISLHEDYLLYVLPRILESKKMAKSGRTKQKEADLEYSVAKQVEKMISEVHEQAVISCDAIHHERRILLKQEIGRMVLFFTDQPSLLAPNIQMVFSALALAQSEVLWYFQHVGISSSKSKTNRIVAVEINASDPTIGFLLDGMDRLCCLVRKYIAAVRGYALSYLSSSAGRIRFLLNTPGMVALDLDSTLKGLFQKIVEHLENIPKPQGENISAITCDLSELRKDWLSILMIVTSARSSINIRHLEKATVSTGKEGLLSEGNALYNWSRCVDELESQLSKHGSLKKLYFYHQHLTTVFRNTMFGPEGRPQHCCAWLGVASSFPECASTIIPEELTRIGRDAVLYVESLIESIMGGLEGLINILDSEGGFGSLEMQLLPEQAAILMNMTSRLSIPSAKSPRGVSGMHLPGYESYPENNNSIKMLEAAMQRLTNLCSVLNDMEPICVLNHVFVLREYMRECILGNFRRRLHAVLKSDTDLQRPTVLESLIRRHVSIIHLAEQHISMDLTQGMREVLLTESFCGPVSSLHTFDKPADQHTGSAIDAVCNWYVENIVKDVSGAGILFAPLHKCFKSTRPVGGYFAEAVTDLKELQAFVRTFGGYGVDRLDRMMKEHTAALLNCIDTSLRANREALEAVLGSIHSGDRIEREANVRQIIDVETVIGFCIQAGQAIAFDSLLAEAGGAVLAEGAPLIHSLLTAVSTHLPVEIPEKKEIRRMRRVANGVGVVADHDSQWVREILEDVGGAVTITNSVTGIMGGGVAMRAAAKVAGISVLNGSLRGGESPVVSAARQAKRSVASVVSSCSSDDLKLSVGCNNDCNNNKSLLAEKACDEDWEFACVEDELFMEAGEPVPRVVFGGAPTIQEARQATSDLNYALEKTYLHPNATNAQKLSDSEYSETKPCLVSETLVAPVPSKHAIQAFRLLNENPKAQSVVASIASDPNVWNAVLQNPDLVDFLQTHKTDVVFPEADSNVNSAFDSTQATGESKAAAGKGFMDYVEEIKQKITVTVVDMMNTLSDTFQSFFGGSSKDGVSVNPDGTAGISMEQTAVGATLMGLAIMVISVVVLKRS